MIGARLFTSIPLMFVRPAEQPRCKSPPSHCLFAAARSPTHDIYARRDRRRGNKIDRTNGKPCSMVNWIRKLPRRAGRCSALPERVIRCCRKMMGAYHARHANDARLLPHQLLYSSSRNLYVTGDVNQLPYIIIASQIISVTTVAMNQV